MAGSDRIWFEAVRTLERGQPFALATVINVRGSTPREVGAKMIVRADGQFGTIGGGCGEAEIFRSAQMLLGRGAGTRLDEVDLTGDFDQQEIGTCGGIMDVFIDMWSPEQSLPVARQLAEAARRNHPAALVTMIDPGARQEPPAGARIVIEHAGSDRGDGPIRIPPRAFEQIGELISDGIPGLLELEDSGALRPVVRIEQGEAPRIFVDPAAGAQRLIICGAGHIAQPLCAFAAMLGFAVTVIDDRASFANRERFGAAAEIIVKPFAAALDSLKLDRRCYVVAVTRGHAFDEDAIRAALRQPAGFVGMIGSRRRVRATLDRLEADGFDPKLLDRVHAPLGLDIGGETPEEIALSIIAEIVRERRAGVRDRLALGVKLGRLKANSQN